MITAHHIEIHLTKNRRYFYYTVYSENALEVISKHYWKKEWCIADIEKYYPGVPYTDIKP